MIQTVGAVIDERGEIRFIEPIQLPPGREVLVTILDEVAHPKPTETALLSEAALSDWNRPEEDEAWAEFQ
jgi:hypothetical protein